MSKEKTIDVVIDLGKLKPAVKRAARASAVTMNEFICNAVESKIRQERDYAQDENFTPHGGKHLFGKHTGYEVTADGKYYVAPQWVATFDLLFAERVAIHNLINTIIAQSETRLVEVEKRIAEAKDSLVDDLGLDKQKRWVYYGGGEYIAEMVDESDPSQLQPKDVKK